MSTDMTASPPTTEGAKESNVVYVVIIFTSAMAFLFIAVVVFYCWKRYNKHSLRLLAKPSTQLISDEPLTSDNYTNGYIIHNGNHTTVRLGTHKGQTVAVKVYPPRYTTQLENERDVYQILPRHPNITKFITTELHNELIVLSYYSRGSLLTYMRETCVTWNQLLCMITSLCRALSFLHNETYAEKGRPAIAHRDLNSRNILLKDNGECVLADFSCSLIMKDTTRPCDQFPMVGSVRCMAPELLSRAPVPVHGWQRAFCQVDSYALGLVLWEICRRCTFLYQPGVTPPKSEVPFEKELGAHPCAVNARRMVCDQQLRPGFLHSWNTEDKAAALLKSTIEECWSHSPEKRLSPLTVFKRTRQMQALIIEEQLAGVCDPLLTHQKQSPPAV